MDKKTSNKKADEQLNSESYLLKKKSSRKKKIDKFEVKQTRCDFNLDAYKDKVIDELSNINKFPRKNMENTAKVKVNTCIDYERIFRKYMQV